MLEQVEKFKVNDWLSVLSAFDGFSIYQLILLDQYIPILFCVRYGYTCPLSKILGGVYEPSKEPVFHKGPPLNKGN